jgi:hypothetical protein
VAQSVFCVHLGWQPFNSGTADVVLQVLSSQQSSGVLHGSPERRQSPAPPVPDDAPLAPPPAPLPEAPAIPSAPPLANAAPPAPNAPPAPLGGALPSLPQELASTAISMSSGQRFRSETSFVRGDCLSIDPVRWPHRRCTRQRRVTRGASPSGVASILNEPTFHGGAALRRPIAEFPH